MNRLNKAGAIFDNITGGLWFLAGVLLILATLAVIFDVTLRKFTPISFPWVIEIDETILLVITFLGAAWCLKIGGHVRDDFIFNMLKKRVQLLVSMVTSALGIMMCLAFAYYCGQDTWDSIQRGTALYKFLKMPKYSYTSIMWLGSLLLAIEFTRITYKYFKMWRARSDDIETSEVR
jgi:TRAP-type C4-dicarboxylate transport system permease small subunit